MAESEDSLFRRGVISSKASAKLKALRGTKHQKGQMVDFDDKGGVRDQGGIRDAGERSVASSRHIDQKQDMGSPARASGKPSKGGSVGKYGQPGAGEIDEGDEQRPEFPKGSGVRGSNGGRMNSRSMAKVQPSGPEYGGPNSRKWG